MTYKATGPWIGAGNLNSVHDEQMHVLGTRVEGVDPVLGQGEFIYLKGVASTAVNDAVVYDEAFATTRTVAASRGPVAIAMAATVANKFGWYQVQGTAIVNGVAGITADTPCSLSATAGSLDKATTASYAVVGARWHSALDTPSTGKAYAILTYPQAAGLTNIT